MNIILDFATDFDRFAERVLRILYEEDRFKTLFDAGIVVNTGLCDEGWVESCLGFEQEKEVTVKGFIKQIGTIFCIEGIFYFGINKDEYENKHNQNIQDSINPYIYIYHGDEYHYALTHWSDKYEYYSDRTLKNFVIDDLERLVDLYCPHYTIVRKINDNKKTYTN